MRCFFDNLDSKAISPKVNVANMAMGQNQCRFLGMRRLFYCSLCLLFWVFTVTCSRGFDPICHSFLFLPCFDYAFLESPWDDVSLVG